MKIDNINIKKLDLPKSIDDYVYNAYDVFTPTVYTANISEVTIAQMNAIRRTSIDELSTYALSISKFETSDSRINKDILEPIISAIPIQQNNYIDDEDVVYTIKERNDSKIGPKWVTSRHITDSSSKKYINNLCNEFPLFTLDPQQFVNMNMIVKSHQGHEKSKGQHAAVCTFTFEPVNEIDPKTIRTKYYTINEFKVMIETNGHIEPNDLILQCCKNIQSRLKETYLSIERTMVVADEYGWKAIIPNEGDTIGNLLHTEIWKNPSSIDLFTYTSDENIRKLEIYINIKQGGSLDERKTLSLKVISMAINRIIRVYNINDINDNSHDNINDDVNDIDVID